MKIDSDISLESPKLGSAFPVYNLKRRWICTSPVFDEPCSALDPIASGTVEDLILSLRGKVTVVIVTHNPNQARRIADRAGGFWVRDGAGALIETGPAEQVFSAPADPDAALYLSGTRG